MAGKSIDRSLIKAMANKTGGFSPSGVHFLGVGERLAAGGASAVATEEERYSYKKSLGLKITLDKADALYFEKLLHQFSTMHSRTYVTEMFEIVSKDIHRAQVIKAPFDTGLLKSGIYYKIQGEVVEFEAEAIDSDTKKDYAPVQEYGGINDEGNYVSPQPFFEGPIDDGFEAMWEVMQTDVDDALAGRAIGQPYYSPFEGLEDQRDADEFRENYESYYDPTGRSRGNSDWDDTFWSGDADPSDFGQRDEGFEALGLYDDY